MSKKPVGLNIFDLDYRNLSNSLTENSALEIFHGEEDLFREIEIDWRSLYICITQIWIGIRHDKKIILKNRLFRPTAFRIRD